MNSKIVGAVAVSLGFFACSAPPDESTSGTDSSNRMNVPEGMSPPAGGSGAIGTPGSGGLGSTMPPSGTGGSGGNAISEPPTVTDSTCGFAGSDSDGPEIVVTNLTPNEVIPHQMVRLTGTLSVPANEVSVTHGGSETQARTAGTEFVAFAILEPGLNYVGLEAEGHEPLCFPVEFAEPENEYTVRYYSFTASDSVDGQFAWLPQNESGGFTCLDDDPCDAQSIADRMKFMGLVQQMLMAETIVASGGPRKTFSLARDESGQPRDALFVSERTVAQVLDDARSVNADQGSWALMDAAGHEMAARISEEGGDPGKVKKVMVFRDIQAGAWGGGNNASLGAGIFNAWPDDLGQFYERIHDTRNTIAEAGAVWTEGRLVQETYDIGMWALLHELGHTYGLPHPDSSPPCAVMGRSNVLSLLQPGVTPNACWTEDNGKPGDVLGVNHLERLLGSAWIKGVGE